MLTNDQFVTHRHILLESMQDNSVAIFPSADIKARNRDSDYPFRQDSDFYYLTGFQEDSACLVLLKKQGQMQSMLFCQPKIKEQEIWTGIRLGPEAAPGTLSVDEAHDINTLSEQLPSMMAGCEAVYAAWGTRPTWDAKIMSAIEVVKLKVRTGITAPTAMLAIEPLLHEQRLVKSSSEIEVMAKAADIAAHAHIRAMQSVQPGQNEYQLEGEIRHHFSQNGCRFEAYASIVGAGDNACILHYTDNNQLISEGDLVLIDAGCELDNYASDITRTFPANGKFSDAQAALYQVVLDAQLAAIEAVKPGNHFNHPHEASVRVITSGLLDLGLINGDLDTLIKEEAFKPFFMHRTGHWLGLDVHDVGAYKQEGEWRTFEEGMVLTVEPGIYVAPDNETVDEKWRGIGIRIEDDVVVTDTGHRVLTSAVPKSIADIEALMAQ